MKNKQIEKKNDRHENEKRIAETTMQRLHIKTELDVINTRERTNQKQHRTHKRKQWRRILFENVIAIPTHISNKRTSRTIALSEMCLQSRG